MVAGAAADDVSGTALTAIGALGALVVGRAVRMLGFETDVLQARAIALERERDEQARAAVAAERARIARELHDVIGHSISVMSVQAGAVRRRLDPASIGNVRHSRPSSGLGVTPWRRCSACSVSYAMTTRVQ